MYKNEKQKTKWLKIEDEDRSTKKWYLNDKPINLGKETLLVLDNPHSDIYRCAMCHREINHKDYCIYCGATFTHRQKPAYDDFNVVKYKNITIKQDWFKNVYVYKDDVLISKSKHDQYHSEVNLLLQAKAFVGE